MFEDNLKWEHPVPGLDVLADADGKVIAKVHRDESTRLWRPAIVGSLITAPEFIGYLEAQGWVNRKLNSGT